jgi:hypothetical protein
LLRADSGFFDDKLLSFLEQRLLPYIVVAKLTPWVKRAAQHVERGDLITFTSLRDQHVEDKEVQWSTGGAIILERVERGLTVPVERNDLAVNDGFIWHGRQSPHDAGIAVAEILVIARAEMDSAAGLYRPGRDSHPA